MGLNAMMTSDDEDDFSGMKQMFRKGGGVRSTNRQGKLGEEEEDARHALNAMGLDSSGLRHRGANEDPPDCEAVMNGERWGIEVTELLDKETLELRLKGGCDWHAWNRGDFLAVLSERIRRKDQPNEVKGGPYDHYLLVVRTEELNLEIPQVLPFLESASFECSLITHACMAWGYHPKLKDKAANTFPAVPITITRAAAE